MRLPGQSFTDTVSQLGLSLGRRPIHTVQINVGKLCNQACRHCHVEAGPSRTEIMEARTVDRLLELLSRAKTIHTVDVTGGAPELCPDFRRLVVGLTQMGKGVIDRCNLTVFEEPGQKDIPEFLAEHRVTIVASLPCYSEANVDKQRGKGVFAKSIRALKTLNRLGYAKPGSGLTLDLVFNPLGPTLPPPQAQLEATYREKLKQDFGIEFTHLYCITNMPIKRFYEDLSRSHMLENYMQLLATHFNQAAAENVMCRDLVSVGWDGRLYDCDFNQMLELPLPGSKRTIWDIDGFDHFNQGPIAFGEHCFGCTAGAGSSCTGTLNREEPNKGK